MITLFTFGRRFGLPDPSPFVMKAEVLLKMANTEYRMDTNGFMKAPKGKLPYIDDNGTRVADSTFIRFHLEKTYKIDFDKGLSQNEKAIAWAFEKMCDEHLYWTMLDYRWIDDANFKHGPATFFQSVPAPIRPFIVKMVRGKMAKSLKAHGMGRHTRAEIEGLAARDLAAIATHLGDKPYFMGDHPTAVDAAIFSFVTGCLCPHFTSPVRTAAESHANLRSYSERLMQKYYPEIVGENAKAKKTKSSRQEASL